MHNALIGYTGFVGGNIHRESDDFFTHLYNSKNTHDIEGKEFDTLVSCGISAETWIANEHPEEDMARIQSLLDTLATVKAKRAVLISTVDVFPEPVEGDESRQVDPSQTLAYGRNRFAAEEWFRAHSGFESVLVVRLVGLFGAGLKKNLIFDYMTGNDPNEFTNAESIFQWYDMSRLWSDIQIGLTHNLPLIHCTAEPLTAKDLAQAVFGETLVGNPEKPLRRYNLKTMHADLFGGENGYFYSRQETIDRIKKFVASQS